MICTLKPIKHWWKLLKKTRINEKKSHAHGLEEIILLQCPYYPEWSTDSMQLLSKFQWHFFTEIDKTMLLEKEEYKWRPHSSWFPTILHSYGNEKKNK